MTRYLTAWSPGGASSQRRAALPVRRTSLADAGVNIELFAPVEYTDGKATIAIGVDKIEEAKRVLSDQLTKWEVPQPAHAGMTR